MNAVSRPAPPGWLKPTVDYVPLAVFFVVYLTAGLIPATGVLIGVTVLAVLLSVAMTRRIPWMPVITAVVVVVFGGLTLWLRDGTFIKMKPTVLYVLFAGILGYGLMRGTSYLRYLMDELLPMTNTCLRSSGRSSPLSTESAFSMATRLLRQIMLKACQPSSFFSSKSANSLF